MWQRTRASLLHLAISAVLVTSVLSLAVLVWYPAPYFAAMGIAKILAILAVVDICIGPMITFVIFNPAKASLKFDLCVIGLLQAAALLYGCSVVFTGRPLYVVYNVDRFTVVSKNEIPPAEFAKLQTRPAVFAGPRIVGARLPASQEERTRLLLSSVQGGPDLPQMPGYYLPYAELADEVRARVLPLNLLTKRKSPEHSSEARRLVYAALQELALSPAEVGFVPLHAKAGDLSVLIRRKDAAILTILPLSP